MTDQPAKILVVDDEPDVKALFELQFRQEIRDGKIKFEFAENGIEALAFFENDPVVDLVLSDINMPEMDGLSLLQRVRETHPEVLVVMVTAYGDLQNIRAAMNAGAFDFLNKPFSLSDLKVTIGNALEQVHKLKSVSRCQEKRNEAQQAFVAELKRTGRSQNEKLANASKKLHGPIEGLVGMGQSLLDGAAGPLNQKTRESLGSMVATGRQLGRIVRGILQEVPRDVQVEADLAPVELGPMVERVVAMCKVQLPTEEVRLVSDVPPDLPQVMADDIQLLEILRKLTEQGLKHKTSGEVRIGAIRAEDGVQVWVKVTDSEAHQPEVGGADGKTEAATELESSPGENPDLDIVDQFLAAQGSRLSIRTKPGHGTRYGFLLAESEEGASAQADMEPMRRTKPPPPPVRKPAEKPSREIDHASSVRNGPFAVLAVDDEPVNLQVLVNQLSLHGIKVDQVNSGKGALAKLADATEYDLVILDVMMPGMSGLEVAREVRKTQALSDLPILMLTARDRPEDVVAGLEAGANDYLAKPFDSAELLARVKSLATLRKAVRHSLNQARQLGAERKQREQLEYLRQFNQDLSSTLELRQVLHRFLDHVNDFAPHDLAFFCLDIQGNFQVIAERETHPYEPNVRTQLHAMCTNWSEILKVKAEPLPIQISDELHQFGAAVAQSLSGAWVGIPLVNRGKLMGTLFLLRRNAGRFEDQELQLAFTFSGQAGLSIENARLFEQVRQLAMTDALTGLYNRRFFFTEGAMAVERALRFGTPLSLLLLDIDHFKRFNDEFGHAVGDLVLVKLAETIKRQCRQADIAGRYGGEEIAVLMPQTKESVAGEVAERLRRAIAELPLVTQDQHLLKVTVSIGVATFREEDKTLDKLLGRADDALYDAKDSGRNCIRAAG